MKVNPVGIQAYQQLLGQKRQPREVDKPDQQAQTDPSVTISPQAESETSRMAVKPGAGSYADSLTAQEREALELLFGKYQDSARFGGVYAKKTEPTEPTTKVGSTIDIKV